MLWNMTKELFEGGSVLSLCITAFFDSSIRWSMNICIILIEAQCCVKLINRNECYMIRSLRINRGSLHFKSSCTINCSPFSEEGLSLSVRSAKLLSCPWRNFNSNSWVPVLLSYFNQSTKGNFYCNKKKLWLLYFFSSEYVLIWILDHNS